MDTSLLAGVISAAPVPLWVIGPDGLVVLANRAALTFLGYEDEHCVLGGPSHDLLHRHRPDGSEYRTESCPIVHSKGTRGATPRQEWFVTQHGDIRPVAWTTEPMGSDGMTLLQFTSVGREAPRATRDGHPYGAAVHEAPVSRREATRTRAYETIRGRFEDPHFSASVLATELHLSARSLQILFQETGCSPAAEIRRVRLDHAFAMLQDGHSVRTACLLSGFVDPDAFGRAFRRHFGYAPSQVLSRPGCRRSSTEGLRVTSDNHCSPSSDPSGDTSP